jgi:hypothetical protein
VSIKAPGQSPALQIKKLSLPLLVFRVGADDPNHAAAMDDLAFVANLFYRCSYFHVA